MISGVGFASANMIGLSAILETISPLTSPPLDRPSKTSAPTNASAKSPSSLSTANFALYSFNSPASSLLFVIIPWESHIKIFSTFTPREM